MSSDLRQVQTVPEDRAGPTAGSHDTRVPYTRTGTVWFGLRVGAARIVQLRRLNRRRTD